MSGELVPQKSSHPEFHIPHDFTEDQRTELIKAKIAQEERIKAEEERIKAEIDAPVIMERAKRWTKFLNKTLPKMALALSIGYAPFGLYFYLGKAQNNQPVPPVIPNSSPTPNGPPTQPIVVNINVQGNRMGGASKRAVQVAAPSDDACADRLIKQLKEAGFLDAKKIWSPENNRFRVYIPADANKADGVKKQLLARLPALEEKPFVRTLASVETSSH